MKKSILGLCLISSVTLFACGNDIEEQAQTQTSTHAVENATDESKVETNVASENKNNASASEQNNGAPYIYKIKDGEDIDYDKVEKMLNDLIYTQIVSSEEDENFTAETSRYQWGIYDFNGDGKYEFLLLMDNDYFCENGGCAMFLVSEDMQIISRFVNIKTPFYIANSKTNNWNDLIFNTSNGWVKHQYDGNKYPYNPLENSNKVAAPDYNTGNIFFTEEGVRYSYFLED